MGSQGHYGEPATARCRSVRTPASQAVGCKGSRVLNKTHFVQLYHTNFLIKKELTRSGLNHLQPLSNSWLKELWKALI